MSKRLLFLLIPLCAVLMGGLTIKRGPGGAGGAEPGTECVFFDVMSINCNNCTDNVDSTGTGHDFDVAEFTNTGGPIEGAWTWPVPENVSGNTATATVYWTTDDLACTGGSGDDVCWTVEVEAFGADEGIYNGSVDNGEQGNWDRCGSAGDGAGWVHVSTIPDSITMNWAAGDLAIVQVARDTESVTSDCTANQDDFAAVADLLGIELCYEVTQPLTGDP